jgi:methionyl-tRNA synthetase
MAAYPDQPEMLPTTVFAHGWIYYEQDKMSKSKGNVVYPEPIIDALDSFGAPGNDALRYYLLREAPFGQDTSFSYEGLIQRYNSDLANDLGNLANRTIAMIHSYLDDVVPPRPEGPLEDDELLKAPDRLKKLEQEAGDLVYEHRARTDAFDFSRGLEAAWRLVARVNEFLVHEEPWVIGRQLDLSKGRYVTESRSKQQLNPILYTSAEAVRICAVILHPILPHAAGRVWKQLGCDQYLGKIEDQRIDQLMWGGLKPGTKVGKPEPIFPRLEKATTLAKLDELAEADRQRDKPAVGALGQAPLQAAPLQANLDKPKEAFIPVQTEKKPEAAPAIGPEQPIPGPQPPAPSPQPPTLISIEDFAKVDMRVGEVKAAERVPGAAKLLKLMVDIGTEVRQLVAGIAECYQPESLIGMKVVVVTNLPPRKLRGVESNGMIVAATVGEQGRPVLVTFNEDVENGARLK